LYGACWLDDKLVEPREGTTESGIDWMRGSDEEDQRWEEDQVEEPNDELPADIFGMTVCALVRDVHFLEVEARSKHRIIRLSIVLTLLVVTIGLQAFLLIEVKRFVTPPPIYQIREAYSNYEQHMYVETTINSHGHYRGVSGFNASRFELLSEEDKEASCSIPLSRPYFFGTVLFLWSVCSFTDLKSTMDLAKSVIWQPETCSNMLDSLKCVGERGSKQYLIQALPLRLKFFLFILAVLPRFLITSRVLYLGSRWLLATTDFGELVLNAVALEFVLLIRKMLFETMITDRSKKDLECTKILKHKQVVNIGVWKLTNAIVWGLLAWLWVVMYMGIPHLHDGLQTSVPGYKWDVADVCRGWFDTRYCVSPPCKPAGHTLLWYFLGVG
jgi:hypothetical protein